MLVSAHEFIAPVSHENGSGHQLEELPLCVATEAAFAHVRHGVRLMNFDKRCVIRPGAAAEIECGERIVPQ
jgi:hypothetical protein